MILLHTYNKEFVKFPQTAIFKKQTFELAESLANKEKAGFLLPAVSIGDPNEIRTRVAALRGPRPRPLDDGTFT